MDGTVVGKERKWRERVEKTNELSKRSRQVGMRGGQLACVEREKIQTLQKTYEKHRLDTSSYYIISVCVYSSVFMGS